MSDLAQYLTKSYGNHVIIYLLNVSIKIFNKYVDRYQDTVQAE